LGRENTFVIYGADNYRKYEFLDQLLQQIGIKYLCNFSILKDEYELCEIINIAQTIPFAEEKRCVVVHNFQWEVLPAKQQEHFLKFLNHVPQQTFLIFFRSELKLTAACFKFITYIKDCATLKEFNLMSDLQLLEFIVSKVKKNGQQISKTNAAHLIKRCSSNLQAIAQEITKLCAHAAACARKSIEESDIDLMTPSSVEQSAFEITKSLLKEDLHLAQIQLSCLLKNNSQPPMIVAAISTLFLDLVRVKIAMLENISSTVFLSDFNDIYKGKAFRVQNAYKLAQSHSMAAIVAYLSVLSDLDVDLKSNFLVQHNSLQDAICRLHMHLTGNI
jgi:DNA polymerase III delta subunit